MARLAGALVAAAAAIAALAHRAAAKTVRETNVTVATRACQPPHDTYPFCDTSLSLADRVNDLISRLEPSDIAPQLTARHGGGGSPGPNDNITRLGIPEYDWGVNSIHGVQTCCVQSADGVVRGAPARTRERCLHSHATALLACRCTAPPAFPTQSTTASPSTAPSSTTSATSSARSSARCGWLGRRRRRPGAACRTRDWTRGAPM